MDRVTLRVNSFQGLQNLPIVMASRLGFFAWSGIEVTLTYANSSAQQLAALVAGDYDLIHTAPDNVINFNTNPAAFGVARAPRVVLLMGGSNGPLTVFLRPGISGVERLRGEAVGVDNPGSGFALVLRDLLARHGLELDRDYRFVVAGGTAKRAEGLLTGAFAATILYPPFDALAAQSGCQAVASSLGTYAEYASQALAAAGPWLDTHGEIASDYIRALLRALAVIYDPAERGQVERALREEDTLGLGAVPISVAYESFVDPGRGFGRDARLDPAGLAQVYALRARYGVSGVELGPSDTHYDLRWYWAALAEAQRSE
jgi:ABC-type nitrate/sulfonate/bicarbonate transport system substrate-binding protein